MAGCIIERRDIEDARTLHALQLLLHERCGLAVSEAEEVARHLQASADSDPDWKRWRVVTDGAGQNHLEWLP